MKTTALFGAAMAGASAIAANTDAANRSELNGLGAEGEHFASRTGLWDLTETIWRSAGAEPETSTDLVAERFMMGAVLQEIIRPADDTSRHDVKRTDLLTFNRVEGRWQYVSFDTRDPVGLMPAWSRNAGDGKSLDLDFYPIAAWNDGGSGGILMRMRQVTSFDGPDSDTKDQYFTLADGNGREWLGHRYSFKRRK
ncbi:hypothetical protein CPY51_23150 [Rhizobium tubonense]|uniref:DUF1579 domain-containing protein n=2 Tax=Rhizobium tubonense TaxID=484088 RepID=A0A2W4CYT6_9HYPH|nr:hypothetical protein CPY51_23150 [Rhizobium tubonense]